VEPAIFQGSKYIHPGAQSAHFRMIEQSQSLDQKYSLDQKVLLQRIIASGYGKLVAVFCFGVFDSLS
jgi:hypothetical protein